jgi:hypothetical protein
MEQLILRPRNFELISQICIERGGFDCNGKEESGASRPGESMI